MLNMARLAVILLLLATSLVALLVWQLNPPPLFDGEETRFLPNFKTQDARHITITQGLGLSGTQRLTFNYSNRHSKQNQEWLLAERGNYPANQELLAELLWRLAQAQKIAPRTKNPAHYGRLGVRAPEELGAATRFHIKDANGATLVNVLLGHEEDSDNESTVSAEALARQRLGADKTARVYMRHQDEARSWLVRARLPRNYKFAAWIDAHLPHHNRNADLVSAQFEPVPESGLTSAVPVKIDDAYRRALAALRPDDVVGVEAIAFGALPPLKLTYANGLEIIYHVHTTSAHIWVRPEVVEIKSADSENPESLAKRESPEKRERFGDYAFRLPPQAATIFLVP